MKKPSPSSWSPSSATPTAPSITQSCSFWTTMDLTSPWRQWQLYMVSLCSPCHLTTIATIGQNSLWTTENLWSKHLCLQWPPQTSHQVSELRAYNYTTGISSQMKIMPHQWKQTGKTQKSPPPVLLLTRLDHHMRSQLVPQVLRQIQSKGGHLPIFRNQILSTHQLMKLALVPMGVMCLQKSYFPCQKPQQEGPEWWESKNKNRDWHA